MTNTKTYWLKQGMQRAEARVERAQRRVEELKLRQEIELIDYKLKVIADYRQTIKPWIKEDDGHKRVILEGPLDPYAGEH